MTSRIGFSYCSYAEYSIGWSEPTGRIPRRRRKEKKIKVELTCAAPSRISADWCHQIAAGTYALRVGIVAPGTPSASVAVAPDTTQPDDTNTEHPARDYFASMEAWVTPTDLHQPRRGGCRWTLEVIRIGTRPRSRSIPPCSPVISAPWCLDVDEDFFACCNPFRDRIVSAMVGCGGGGGSTRANWKTFYQLNSPETDYVRHHRWVRAFWTAAPWRLRGGRVAYQNHVSVRRLRNAGGVPVAVLERMYALAPRLRRALSVEYLCTAGECVGLPRGSAITFLLKVFDALQTGFLRQDKAGLPERVTIARSVADGYVNQPRLHARVCATLSILYNTR